MPELQNAIECIRNVQLALISNLPTSSLLII